MTTEIRASVVVCTYNPRPDYFERTLAALEAQRYPRDRWELIIIDNASDVPLESRLSLAWHPQGRIVRENQPGTGYARVRGMRESRGDIIIFCDDDNLLQADYVQRAVEIGDAWPMLGIWGGENLPEFEVKPEPWTEEFWGLMAIRRLERDVWSNCWDQFETVPHGAGMCFRHSVADYYLAQAALNSKWITVGRTGTGLAGGVEDGVLAMCTFAMNMGSGMFRSLQLTHLIPARRMEEAYLLRLIESLAYSSICLRHLHHRPIPQQGSRVDRLVHWYKVWRSSPRNHRIDAARRRGIKAAWADLGLTGSPRLW